MALTTSKLTQIEKLLPELSRAEKATLLQWVVSELSDSYSGIEATPQVCGGEPCIIRTRIPVWLLVEARHLGMSDADLLLAYPTLRADDLSNAWNYYRAHRTDIEQQILDNWLFDASPSTIS